MAFDYINEAFKRLDLLEEQMFDTSLNGINQLSDFMNNNDVDDVVRVIDPEADTPDEIQDSYVGKVIINCNVCHSHVFEDKEEIKIEEDGLVNVETACPYCGEQEGFTIVGEIVPFGKEEMSEEESDDLTSEEEVVEAEESEELEEAVPAIAGALAAGAASALGAKLVDKFMDEDVDGAEEDKHENKSLRMSRATRRVMSEDFKEVSITTEDQHLEMTSDENGKVTVTTEPVEAVTEETIAPVSVETQEEILDNNDIEDLTLEEEPVEGASDNLEFNFDDIDEEGMDELGESYLRNVYDNVSSFKTTSVSANDTSLIVEGVIEFNSGVKKNTGFIFEAKDANSRGQLRFVGSNKHLTESMNAFSLVGRVDNNKLFVESLKYNYAVNDNMVRGIVRRK